MPTQLARSRNDGRTFELRITHRALPKPVHRTFNSEARRAGQSASQVLACTPACAGLP